MATLTGGRGWLNDDAAASLHRMDAQKGSLVQVTEAGRTNAQQWALWNRWQAGGTYNRPPYLYQPAYPGTSPHEAGNAIDSNDSWLLSYGGRNGWRRNIPSDVVHWIYEPWNDQYAGGSGGGGGGAWGDINNIGSAYVEELQRQLGVDVDGIAGPQTITALQARVGAVQDGEWGPDTLSRTQAFVGADVDGVWGPQSDSYIKAAIDAGKFRTGGTADPDVLAAQKKLNKLGYGLVEDGIKGPATLAAIKDFQTKYGLVVDGIFGPESNAKADQLIAQGPPPATDPPSGQYPEGYYRPTNAPVGSLFGIDISRWDRDRGFDIAAWAAGAKEDFIILKRGGSNAGTYIDDAYPAQLPKARATGLKIGHYWFNGREGVASPKASAQAFLKDFDIKPGELAVLDIEAEGSDPAYDVWEAMEFGAEVERQLGIKPLFYMNASYARDPMWKMAVDAGYKLWVAMYTYNPGPKAGLYEPNDVDPLNAWGDGDAWVIHQYTSTVYGKMPGLPSGVTALDRNIAKPDTWAKYGFVKRPEPPTTTDPVIVMARAKAAALQSAATELVELLD